EQAKRIIDDEDWSACSNKFKLAAAVLLDDETTAIRMMKEIGTTGKPGKSEYRNWPLFRKFRETNAFNSKFIHLFGEPINETPSGPENVLEVRRSVKSPDEQLPEPATEVEDSRN